MSEFIDCVAFCLAFAELLSNLPREEALLIDLVSERRLDQLEIVACVLLDNGVMSGRDDLVDGKRREYK